MQVVNTAEEQIKAPALAAAEAVGPTGGSSSRAKSVTAQTTPGGPMDLLRAN